jgi:kinesin family protein 15
VGKPIVD